MYPKRLMSVGELNNLLKEFYGNDLPNKSQVASAEPNNPRATVEPSRVFQFVNQSQNEITPSKSSSKEYLESKKLLKSLKSKYLGKNSKLDRYFKLMNDLNYYYKFSQPAAGKNNKYWTEKKDILNQFNKTKNEEIIKKYILYLYFSILHSYLNKKQNLSSETIDHITRILFGRDMVFVEALRKLNRNHKDFLSKIQSKSNFNEQDKETISKVSEIIFNPAHEQKIYYHLNNTIQVEPKQKNPKQKQPKEPTKPVISTYQPESHTFRRITPLVRPPKVGNPKKTRESGIRFEPYNPFLFFEKTK